MPFDAELAGARFLDNSFINMPSTNAIKQLQDFRNAQAAQENMESAKQRYAMRGQILSQSGGDPERLKAAAQALLQANDVKGATQLFNMAGSIEKEARLQQQQKLMQDALMGGALEGGGDADKLAALGAMSGNPQLMQLATFKQGQENRTIDEQNRIAAEERAATRQIEAEARTKEEKIAAEKRAAAEKGAQFYATKLEDSGLPELYQQMKNVKTLLPEEGQDIAGFGYGNGALPNVLISQEGKDLRQAVSGVRNAILKARSGGAVTPQEATRLLEELGEGGLNSDEQLRKGLKSVENTLNAKVKNFAAGVSPEAISEYQARGGEIVPKSKYEDLSLEQLQAIKAQRQKK